MRVRKILSASIVLTFLFQISLSAFALKAKAVSTDEQIKEVLTEENQNSNNLLANEKQDDEFFQVDDFQNQFLPEVKKTTLSNEKNSSSTQIVPQQSPQATIQPLNSDYYYSPITIRVDYSGGEEINKVELWYFYENEDATVTKEEILYKTENVSGLNGQVEFEFNFPHSIGYYYFYALAEDITAQREALPKAVFEQRTGYFYPLINEVYYFWKDEAGEQFIEIYNPSLFYFFNLAGWRISDGEGSFYFPENTNLLPDTFIVIARKATDFQARFGVYPDFELEESLLEVPNLLQFSSGFDLEKEGDEVFLRVPDNGFLYDVDVVCWGDSSYEECIPHEGVANENQSLERKVFQDTNNCALDFQILEQPDPNPEPYIYEVFIEPSSPTKNNHPIVEVRVVDFNLDFNNLWVYFENQKGELYRALLDEQFSTGESFFEVQQGGGWRDYGLTLPDGKYKIWAEVFDIVGNKTTKGVAENYIIDTTSPPSPSLAIVKKTSNSVSLSWQAVMDENSGTAGYILFWGKKEGVWESKRDVGDTTSATIFSLLPSTAYFFAIQAYDQVGNKSFLSKIVSTTTPILKTVEVTYKPYEPSQALAAPLKEAEEEIKGEEGPEEEERKDTNWLKILIGLGIVVGLGAGVYTYLWWKRKKGFRLPF